MIHVMRLRTLHSLLASVAMAALPVGCSILTSTDGLVGGGAGDAGADHATSDATGFDATGDAPTGPFCSTLSPMPALCEDFDGTNAFAAQFSDKLEPSPNHIGADTTFFKSPTRSFFAKVDPGVATGDSYAYMFKLFMTSATHVSFGFDIMMVDVVNGKYAVAAGIVINEGMPTRHGLALVASGTDASLEESFRADGGTRYFDTPLAVSPVAKTWSRVQIDLSLTSSPATVSVTVDGKTSLSSAPLDASWPTSGTVQINLGMTYVNDTNGPWLIRYDNVTVDPK